MKANIFYIILLLNLSVFSQTKSQINDIISNYDLDKLETISNTFNTDHKTQLEKLERLANINNWALSYSDEDGTKYQLRRVYNGKPIYIQTSNATASTSTRAKFLYNNGGLGLNIEGQNMIGHVWDGGHALAGHVEFQENGSSKITLGDASTPTLSDHGTHVCGTISAVGVNQTAKGMAHKSSIISYEWTNDKAEVTTAAANGMLLSNHSYGYSVNDLPDWEYGAYVIESRRWDVISYNAPYYTTVIAAGNDGANFSGNADPLAGNYLYDKLSDNTVSKNPIVVANGQDLFINNTTGAILSPINLNNSSSQGPTDDLRIKPDITGNGTSVYSPIGTSNTSYASYDGTSMAAPSVMGSLLLLQQLYNDTNGQFAYAATIKGLALHTADDGGSVIGPDSRFGWGYMNTKKSAEIIISSDAIIEEKVINQGGSISFEVTSNGVTPLIASISWTDPPANNVNYGFSNRPDPVLVNDLDIRITQNTTTHFPWKLTSVTTNDKIDNNVDPYEKIEIDNPNGTYTITINHKGTLRDNHQDYSLIVSGITYNNLSVNENNTTGIAMWPNPANEILNLSLKSNNIANVKITNLLGKIVKLVTLNNPNSNNSINISALNSGFYLITISQDNKTITNKFIKN